MSFLSKLFSPGRPPRRDEASANEIPKVIRQLQQSGADGHFVVFMFVLTGASVDQDINLQYSIEGGVVGLDWVLIGPRNIADKAKVLELASKLGHQLEERFENNCRYLRLSGDGIAELGARIIQDLYKIAPDTKLEIMTEGFEWQP
jgi:hypothetical protein